MTAHNRAVTLSAAVAIALLGTVGTATSPAVADEVIPVLEPTVTLVDHPAEHDDAISWVEEYTDWGAVVRYDRTERLLWYGQDLAEHRVLPADDPVELADGWIIDRQDYWDNHVPTVEIESIDGTITRSVLLGDVATYAVAVADGWLELVLDDDSGAGPTTAHLVHVAIASNGSTTRSDLGVALSAPAGATLDEPSVSGLAAPDGSRAQLSVAAIASTGPSSTTTRALIAYDPATSAITELATGGEDDWFQLQAVTADAGYVVHHHYTDDAVSTTLIRYADGTSTSWATHVDPMQVVEVAGVPQWLVWDSDLGDVVAYRGNADGSMTPIATPWWAEANLVTVAEPFVGIDGGELRSYASDGSSSTVLTPGHPAPLAVSAVAIDGDQVAWADDTRAGDLNTVWSRSLTGSGAPSVVVERATGYSLALIGDDVYTLQDQQPGVTLERIGTAGSTRLSSAEANVAATAITLSTSSTELLADRYSDFWTGLVGPVPAGPMAASGVDAIGDGWRATFDEDGGTAFTTVTATGVQHAYTAPDAVDVDLFGAGDSLVQRVQSGAPSGGTRSMVSVTDVDTHVTKVLVEAESASVVATSADHVAVESGGWTTVYDVHTGEAAFELNTSLSLAGFHQVTVALGERWVAWLTTGAHGDKLVAAPIPGAQVFPDVPPSHGFYTEIMWLADQGITTGYPDGTYGPKKSVTRGAMAAFLYRFAESPAYTAPAKAMFPDVPKGSSFYKEISWLASTGITTGYPDGTYRKTNPVTRGAMAAFLYRYAGTLPSDG